MQGERLSQRALTLFDITLNQQQLEQMAIYEHEMLEWNEHRCNLTAITLPDEVEVRHFLDSMSVLSYVEIPDNGRVADVGTGAGFPALVFKILRPDLHVTLIESIGKKTDFLIHLTRLLNLQNVEILTERAETVGQNPNHREKYDVVVARAVAQMPILAEYMLPLCKIGGRCVAMKGNSALKEIEEGAFAIQVLGGKFAAMYPIVLPEVEAPHMLLTIEKNEETPKKYPRAVGMPAKRPLVLKQDAKGRPKPESFDDDDEEA